MCRIKNEPHKYELITEKRTKINEIDSVSICMQDPIEGNITISISIEMETDKDGVTRIEHIENNEIKVTIVNPNPVSIVTPNEPMEIGSYMQNKKLYMDYKLYTKYDDDEYREIKVEFGTKKE